MPRAARRRAPKMWRTASGQMMVRNSPAYIPPDEVPAVLQLGMFNTWHDGDEAIAMRTDQVDQVDSVAAHAATDPASQGDDPGDDPGDDLDRHIAALPEAEREAIEQATAAPDPTMQIIAHDAQPDAQPAKPKGRRKKVQTAPQEWPAECPPGYAVKVVHGTCFQPVRLAYPDQPGGAYFVLLDDQESGAIAKYCATERQAIEWLWAVAIGKSISIMADGFRAALVRYAEQHMDDGTPTAITASGPPAPPKKRAGKRNTGGQG